MKSVGIEIIQLIHMLISGCHSLTSPKLCRLHTNFFYLIFDKTKTNIEVFNFISFRSGPECVP